MLTKKDKKKRYNKKTKSLTGHEFSGTWTEQSSKAWKNAGGSNLGGSISSVAGGIGGIVEAGMANAQIADTTEQEQEREARENWQSSANDNNSLLAEMASDVSINENTNWKSIRGVTPGQMVGNTLKGVVSGAGAGAKVGGPWGAVAGAAVGLAGGLAGIFAGNSKAQKKAAELNEAAKKANLAKAQTLTAKAGALDQAADQRALAAYAAYGGDINTPKFPDFPSEITEFNTGGSHEENPYDGIPQGIAPDGLPNLVEEGEVKFDNYIFSDRLMLTKEDKKKYKFLKGKTYADAAKRIKKDLGIDERPNDLIAKTDLEEQLNLLSTLQENERAKRGLRGENRMMYAFGGHTFDATTNTNTPPNVWVDRNGNLFYVQNWKNGDQVKRLKELGYRPGWEYSLADSKTSGAIAVQGANYLATKNRMSLKTPQDTSGGSPVAYNGKSAKYFVSSKVDDPLLQEMVVTPQAMSFYNDGDPIDATFYTTTFEGEGLAPPKGLTSKISPLQREELDLSEVGTPYSRDGFDTTSFLRAAPVIGNAIGALAQAFNKPDYKHAKELQKSNEPFTPVSYTPVTQRLEYKPFDINYFGNKLQAQASATRRALREQTASNPYAATSALLMADANAQAQLGDLYKKAEDHNMTQREKVEAFNRATDAANAEMAMKTRQINASLLNNTYDRKVKRDLYAQQMKMAEDQMWSNATSANLTSLFDNLGLIGREREEQENAAAKIIAEAKNLTPELEEWGRRRGLVQAHGGRIKTKKKYYTF